MILYGIISGMIATILCWLLSGLSNESGYKKELKKNVRLFKYGLVGTIIGTAISLFI
ncbi:hypothetical protein P4308_12030 [Bacillus wiedmannii]|uniref:hypothetical protein n=1 Tax=Bacillus wiedmannii TaxID=1890302 RepID=UPI001CBFE739|nr:hypothetical protein [Bacillus wiedmannii]MBZ4223057.1 hypothetical protein [Bacillus wiedmannii]MED2932838.1 hypothetical protein [Bacillus wiedmannii]